MTVIDNTRAYKLSEMSAITGVPQTTLTRWARAGQIKARKAGKLWRITGEGIKYFLEHGTEGDGGHRNG